MQTRPAPAAPHGRGRAPTSLVLAVASCRHTRSGWSAMDRRQLRVLRLVPPALFRSHVCVLAGMPLGDHSRHAASLLHQRRQLLRTHAHGPPARHDARPAAPLKVQEVRRVRVEFEVGAQRRVGTLQSSARTLMSSTRTRTRTPAQTAYRAIAPMRAIDDAHRTASRQSNSRRVRVCSRECFGSTCVHPYACAHGA